MCLVENPFNDYLASIRAARTRPDVSPTPAVEAEAEIECANAEDH